VFRDRTANLTRDLLIQIHRVAPVDLDIQRDGASNTSSTRSRMQP
jgi:hypothetical protein